MCAYLFVKNKKGGIRILAARRCSVRLGSDSLAAARSHSGSDSHPRLSFIALVPLRCVKGASFTTEPVRIRLSKGKGGFEFSQLDAARSGSALTCQRARHSLPSPFESACQKEKGGFEFSRLDDARSGSALTAVKGCHSLPSPFESPVPKGKGHHRCPFPFGLPWGIRTPNRQNRNLILYPIALRADIKSLAGFSHFLKDL